MSVGEARILGRYALGRDVNRTVCDAYARAARDLEYDGEDAVTRFVVLRPWTLPALDGALALTQPDALLRKKLLLVTAILETQPDYCDAFFPRDRRLDVLFVAAATIRAALAAAAGLLLLRFVR